MTAHKEFIEILLEKSKDFDEGILIPNEIKLKISDFEEFNLLIADELSKLEEVILIREQTFNNEVVRKEEFKVILLKYSFEEDSIAFYPVALKNYLKKN